MLEILPVMLALYLVLINTYYSQNYADIIGTTESNSDLPLGGSLRRNIPFLMAIPFKQYYITVIAKWFREVIVRSYCNQFHSRPGLSVHWTDRIPR